MRRPSSVSRMLSRKRSGSMSLRKYPSAPARMQATRSSPESLTVRITMRREGSSSLRIERISTPEDPLMLRSSTMRSGSSLRASAMASSRVPASPTTSIDSSSERSSLTPRLRSG